MGVVEIVEQPRPRGQPPTKPNCSYMGLVQLREKNIDKLQEPVSGDHLLWNYGEKQLKTSAFEENRNQLIHEAHHNRIQANANHQIVYDLIVQCEETKNIPWRYVLNQHKDLPKIKNNLVSGSRSER